MIFKHPGALSGCFGFITPTRQLGLPAYVTVARIVPWQIF